MSKKSEGFISQVIGPVVDVSFEQDQPLPNVHDSLEITKSDGHLVVLEAQQDIGENTIRTVAMDSTDGLYRGMKVINTGHPIEMPVSEHIQRQAFQRDRKNRLTDLKPIEKEQTYAIHREPPKFDTN
jgi:F-type H+/Na+-transporting ATPase subunit beta